MARYSALALAALLSLPVYSWADEMCIPGQQQHGQQQDAKNGRGDQGHRPHWWIDPQLRQQLGITDAQSKAVEEIWQKSVPELRDSWKRLNQLEDTLNKMIQDAADESAVVAQIEKVENARAEVNKGRTHMIYRMFRVLTPEQRAKVNALMFPPRDDRRGGGRGSQR